MVIGLVGGIASGKSFVAEEFERLGARRLDADRAGHEALADPEIRQRLVERWGPAILEEHGRPSRRRIAAKVFSAPPDGPRELQFLESVTHPWIGARLAQELQRLAELGTKVVVLDAPVMLEAGWNRLCDRIVFVEAPADVRRRRAASRGWSEAEFAAREAAQMSLDEKRGAADGVIVNSGTPAETRAQVEQLWRRWTG